MRVREFTLLLITAGNFGKRSSNRTRERAGKGIRSPDKDVI